jgi:hypothetical protein
MGASGEHSADFSSLAPDPWDHHAVVSGRLVPQPDDHRCLGPLLDRNALRPCHGPTADRRGMICDGTSQAVGEVGVFFMKSQELQDRTVEVFDVLGLGLLTSAVVGLLLLGVAFGGSLCRKFGPDTLDGR